MGVLLRRWTAAIRGRALAELFLLVVVLLVEVLLVRRYADAFGTLYE